MTVSHREGTPNQGQKPIWQIRPKSDDDGLDSLTTKRLLKGPLSLMLKEGFRKL
jgi:hypothetical protein